MNDNYLFTSARLGFRTWKDADLGVLRAMNSDEAVMRYFPNTNNEEQDRNLLSKLQDRYTKHGYTYYAVEALENQDCIGFIGISYQTFDSPFTPCIDIGWRLLQRHWGKGYATEGAKRVLLFATLELGLTEIYAFAPAINTPSINVMKKIGMSYHDTFEFSLLNESPELKDCVVYKITLN